MYIHNLPPIKKETKQKLTLTLTKWSECQFKMWNTAQVAYHLHFLHQTHKK